MNITVKPENINSREALTGKVSLITGSTSGIGLGIARALAAAGSEIVLNGFGKPEEVADVQAKIAADFKVRVTFSPADMSKPAAISEMIEKTLQTSGRLDILVNNAGIQHVAPLQDFPPEKWDAILAIDLSSAFHTTRLALPSMIANKCDDRQQVGPRHQHSVGARFGGLAIQISLCHCQTWNCRADQSHGVGDCRTRHYLQCHLSRLCLYAPGRGADRWPSQGT